jgi:hypothetical protein
MAIPKPSPTANRSWPPNELVARLAETDVEPPAEHEPSAAVCARPGCTQPVASRQHSYGRPPIYCSPECRPSYKRDPRTVTVELDHDDDDGRYWTVRLRRGHRTVLVAQHLGRFSATLLYRDLDQLLHPRSAPKGGAID